jgi:hypothetical protein
MLRCSEMGSCCIMAAPVHACSQVTAQAQSSEDRSPNMHMVCAKGNMHDQACAVVAPRHCTTARSSVMLLVLPGKRKDTGALQKPCATEQSGPAQPQSHWHVAFAAGAVAFNDAMVDADAVASATQVPRKPQDRSQPSTASATIEPLITTSAVTPWLTAASN